MYSKTLTDRGVSVLQGFLDCKREYGDQTNDRKIVGENYIRRSFSDKNLDCSGVSCLKMSFSRAQICKPAIKEEIREVEMGEISLKPDEIAVSMASLIILLTCLGQDIDIIFWGSMLLIIL